MTGRIQKRKILDFPYLAPDFKAIIAYQTFSGSKFMKINFSTRIFTLFIFTCAFASAIVAQEKPQALKFGEFEEPYESSFTAYQDELSITERAKRFGRQFIKMRGVK
ncbi:MAG: hypothetical protein LH472_05495, partial [Pyrinomonadaceae bacterium]|nr:hypothetical protein [Pyrinomonadaceae bacterium]